MHCCQTKSFAAKEQAVEMVSDGLDSWYAAECDAEVGVSIATSNVRRAEVVRNPSKGTHANDLKDGQ